MAFDPRDPPRYAFALPRRSPPLELPPQGAPKSVIVEKSNHGHSTLLKVEGTIKLGESAQFFAQTLKRALETEPGHVLVDLSEINYIDSTGIGELVGYLGRFRDTGRKLVLVNPSERIRKLLKIAKLDDLFPIYDTLDAALAELDPAAAG